MMKKGWEYIDYKDIFPVKMGKTPPRGDMSCWDTEKKGNNKWVSIADISNNEGKVVYDTKEYISDSAAERINKVAQGSLLMSFKLSIGKMAFAGDDLYTNEAIVAIPDNPHYNLRFIYYYLLSYDWKSLTDGNEKVKGATLNKKTIGQIKLPIIPLSEQKEIVEYLDSSFAKIDTLKANAAKNLDEAKALFQSALKEALEPKKGWEEKALKEVSLSITDGDHMPPPKANEGIPFITISNIDKETNALNMKDTFYVPEDYYNSLKEDRKPQIGDLLYTVTGSFGIPVVVESDKRFCFQRHIAMIRPDKAQVLCKYLYYWCLSPNAKSEADKVATGTAQRTVSLTSLRKFIIPVPSIKEQEMLISYLYSLERKVNTLQQNYSRICSECDALKQAILRQVFE